MMNYRYFQFVIFTWSYMSFSLLQAGTVVLTGTTGTNMTIEEPISCSNKSRIFAEYHYEAKSVRIKVCVCSALKDIGLVKLAETEEFCRSSVFISHLRLERNVSTSSDLHCFLTEPLDFDPFNYTSDTLNLCSPVELVISRDRTVPIPPPSFKEDVGSRSVRSAKQEDGEVIRVPDDFRPAVITGLRVEEADKGTTYDEDGASVVLAGTLVSVRLFGYDFSNASEFRFVLGARPRGADCDNLPFTVNFHVDQDSLTMYSTLVHFRLPSADQISEKDPAVGESPAFYVCSLERSNGNRRWIHQGKEPGVKLRTFQRALPLWIQIAICTVLLTLSGLFSGLNLGLMALDRTELKIYENTGSEREKRYANAIIPVRNHGNYLLCTLLLGNVLVNSTLTILLDDLTSGIIAIIGSTLGIVIFGEIIPQAICSRFGLAIGAHTVWITKFFMLITFPLSYPISLILDKILGEEIGAYYNRERLKELIKVTNEYHDLEKEEVNIIAGALEMRRKTVGDIMTRLEDVFMLSYDSVLDFETVSEIMKQGFSRIPVYEGERSNIIALLFIKELALVDPEDATPLKTLCQFYQNQCNFVFEDTTLDVMFKEFKEGHKGHMAFVQRVNCEGEGDPFYETVGLVTLEDVIEELIQAEIVDETDVWMDNRSKRRREKGKLLQDFSSFAVQYREQTVHKISPQLALATFQFLSSSLDPFKSDFISESVLRRLMQHGLVIRYIRVKDKDKQKNDPETIIYQQGKPADYFALILEGRVEVTVGRENLVFESGPFSHYATQALTANMGGTTMGLGESPSSAQLFKGSVQSVQAPPPATDSMGTGGVRSQAFVPDYTLRAITNVVYLRVTRSLYQAARSATLLERAQRDATLRVHDYESDLEQVFGGSCNREEIDLLSSHPASEMSPQDQKGSLQSVNNQRRNSISRSQLGRQQGRIQDREHENLLTSSLPSTPSSALADNAATCSSNYQPPVKTPSSAPSSQQQGNGFAESAQQPYAQVDVSLSDCGSSDCKEQVTEESLLVASSPDERKALLPRSSNSSNPGANTS